MTLTRHETTQMRQAWVAGYDTAAAGKAPSAAADFKGQPGRNFRNYQDGYLNGALDLKQGVV